MEVEEKAVAEREKDLAAQRKRRGESQRRWYEKNKDRPEVRSKANAAARRCYAARKLKEAVQVSGRPKPNTCEVCGNGGKICFDHCHVEKKFRGWLCNSCNLVLGHVKDNPTRLYKLAAYLETNSGSVC